MPLSNHFCYVCFFFRCKNTFALIWNCKLSSNLHSAKNQHCWNGWSKNAEAKTHTRRTAEKRQQKSVHKLNCGGPVRCSDGSVEGDATPSLNLIALHVPLLKILLIAFLAKIKLNICWITNTFNGNSQDRAILNGWLCETEKKNGSIDIKGAQNSIPKRGFRNCLQKRKYARIHRTNLFATSEFFFFLLQIIFSRRRGEG